MIEECKCLKIETCSDLNHNATKKMGKDESGGQVKNYCSGCSAASIKRIIFSYPHHNQLKITVLIVMKGSNSKERGSRNNSKNKKHRESSDEDSEVRIMMMIMMMMTRRRRMMMIIMMTIKISIKTRWSLL